MFEGLRASLASMLLGKQSSSAFQSFMQTVAGKSPPVRGTAELIAYYNASPFLRMVVSRIASSMAAVPWTLYRAPTKTAQTERLLRGLEPAEWLKTFRRLKQEGTLVEVPGNPVSTVLEGPNPALSGIAVRRLTWVWLELKGEAPWILERDSSGNIVEVWPVPPHWLTKAIITPGDGKFEVQIASKKILVDFNDMLWIRDANPANPYDRGTGIGQTLADEIETDEYAARFMKSFFFNSARPDLLISVGNDKSKPNADALKALRADFENRFRGISKQHQTMWFGGPVDVKDLQRSPGDLGMIPIRTWERDAIVNTWGAPPEIFGILTNSNRATITEARKLFVEMIMLPRLDFYRAEIQHKLLDREGIEGVLAYEPTWAADTELMLKQVQVAPWAVTRREIREAFGFADRGPSDDVYMTPIGLVPEVAPQKVVGDPKAAEGSEAKALPDRRLTIVREFTEDDVGSALDALRPERLSVRVRDLWSQELQTWIADTLHDMDLEPSFDILNPRTLDHLNNFAGERISKINDTTREKIRAQLLEGVRAGESIDDLAKRVGAVFDEARGSRSELIARTEVNRSANFGTFEAHTISGVVAQRQWVATPDDRTRDEHNALDGQIVAIDEPFTIDGYSAMYPGGFKEPEMSINCRCTTAPVIAERTFDQDHRKAIWVKFDQSMIPWARAARGAFGRGFDDQERDVLAALRRLAA